MYSNSSDLEHKSLKIKEDDKFFSRLLSKESSMANPSFRVAVAVPFMWETQPGTPKHFLSENTFLPPLTPPPSYFSNSSIKKTSKKRSASNLIHILFSRMIPKKSTTSSFSSTSFPSCPSSSSVSSSSGSGFVHSRKIGGRRRFSSCGSSFDSRVYEDDRDAVILSSPDSTPCYGSSRGTKKW